MNWRGRIKAGVIRTTRALGYELRRVAPEDLRDKNIDARSATLEAERRLPRGLLVDVPINYLRGSGGWSLMEKHPFVRALEAGVIASYEESVLSSYYEEFQPNTACEAMGVPEEEAAGFVGLPPTAYVLPWYDIAPGEMMGMRERWMRSEGKQYGVSVGVENGFTDFGPVSYKKGQLEVIRLNRVYSSVRDNGFRRNDQQGGDVEAWLLTQSSGSWCCLIRGGQHRSIAAAALGYSHIPVRLRYAPIKREEVMYWPQVQAGRITPSGALMVFDRIMRGEGPEVGCCPVAESGHA